MTLDEKLKKFYDLSLEQAAAESDAELDRYQKQLDAAFEEHKAEKERQARASEEEERASISRDLNKEFSARQVALRQKIAARQEEIKAQLFARALDRLMAFKKTPDYTGFLASKIRAARAFAGSDEVRFYIDPSDSTLKKTLEEQTGETLTISRPGEEFDGGLRAVIPARHVLLDNSFRYRLAEIRDSYTLQ